MSTTVTVAKRFAAAVGLVLLAGAPLFAAASPDEIRAKRNEVFERPEFRSSNAANNWIVRQLRDFFHWLGTLYDVSPFLFWTIFIGCVLILIVLIAHIAITVRRAFAIGRAVTAAGEAAQRRILSENYREEAFRRAAEGEYTEAVRYLFLSLVYRFDERGRISLHKAYTNREYLDLVEENSRARDALRVMVDTLDDHWYGQTACGVEQYEACRREYERLVSTI
jgi:uncharacterized membrane protein YhaH (DUF805 family)